MVAVQIENLEPRRLMSVSLNAATHVLTVSGADGPDKVAVSQTATQIKVVDNGATRTFALSAVSKLVVNAKGGQDDVRLAASVTRPSTIDVGDSLQEYVQGGSGADVIHARGGYGKFYGGGGNDTLNNYGGPNKLYGEAGNDLLVTKDAVYDTTESVYDGGAGSDTLDFSVATEGVVMRNGETGHYYEGSGYPPTLRGGQIDFVAAVENFTGGAGADYIYGGAGPNVLRGNGGNDYIRGGGGNDTIYGGAGKNALYGDDGNDTFYSKNTIADFLSGGNGTDKANKDASDVLNSVEGSF